MRIMELDNNTLSQLVLNHLANHFSCFSKNLSTTTGVEANATESRPDAFANEQDAFIYIIAVLGFYSFGVIIMMIKFLQRERIDLEEEEVLAKFLEGLKKSREFPKPQRRSSLKYAKARLASARASLPCINFNTVLALSKKRPSLVGALNSNSRIQDPVRFSESVVEIG